MLRQFASLLDAVGVPEVVLLRPVVGAALDPEAPSAGSQVAVPGIRDLDREAVWLVRSAGFEDVRGAKLRRRKDLFPVDRVVAKITAGT